MCFFFEVLNYCRCIYQNLYAETIRLLTNSKSSIQRPKISQKNKMESKLEGPITYLEFIDCTLNAAKQKEQLQDRPPQ